MNLTDLIVENAEYKKLIEQFEKKIETLKGIIEPKDFIQKEIVRIKAFYTRPAVVTVVTGRIVSSFNFSKYVKYAYDWLSSGNDYSIEHLIKNAQQSTDHPIYDEVEFAKAITDNLRKGVALVLYEQFLKQKLLGLNSNKNIAMEQNKKEVLITYSWDSLQHQLNAVGLTEYLRQQGFAADIDLKLSQEETSIDFTKMMHQSFVEYSYIVIILSKGYKKKAETFKGGVGAEYRLMLSDIEKNPKKYILVSFESISNSIVPIGIDGREIVDLSKSDGREKLLRKLLDKPEFEFSPIADKKPSFTSKKIEVFTPSQQTGGIVNNSNNGNINNNTIVIPKESQAGIIGNSNNGDISGNKFIQE